MASPPKITAEWTVRAQLTIRKSGSGGPTLPSADADSGGTVERLVHTDNPMKVTYKWCTHEPLLDHRPPASHASSSSSHKDGTLSSAGPVSSDSGIGSTPTKPHTLAAPPSDPNSSQFQSSCNIILTACTNIVPEHSEYAEDLSTTFYTLFPDGGETKVTSNVPANGTAAAAAFGVKDAFCQTSDNEALTKHPANESLEAEHPYRVGDHGTRFESATD